MPTRSQVRPSEREPKTCEGLIFVANSTTFGWNLEVITNESEIGNISSHQHTIGPHKALELSCIYSEGNKFEAYPFVVKATMRNGDLKSPISHELPVKDKSGLIITETKLIVSKRINTKV